MAKKTKEVEFKTRRADYRTKDYVTKDREDTLAAVRAVHRIPSALYTPETEDAVMGQIGHATESPAPMVEDFDEDDDKLSLDDMKALEELAREWENR